MLLLPSVSKDYPLSGSLKFSSVFGFGPRSLVPKTVTLSLSFITSGLLPPT